MATTRKNLPTVEEKKARRAQVEWLRTQTQFSFQIVINFDDTQSVFHIARSDVDVNAPDAKCFCGKVLDDPDYFEPNLKTSQILRQGICAKCYTSCRVWVGKQPQPIHPELSVKRIEFIDFNHALTEDYLRSGKTRKGKSNSRDLRNARLYRTGDGELVLQAKCGEEYGLSIPRLRAVLVASEELVVVSADLGPSSENDGSLDEDDY